MKLEIRSYYWPNTPNLREIKILLDGKVIESSFMNDKEIWDLAKKCRELDDYLMDVGNGMQE